MDASSRTSKHKPSAKLMFHIHNQNRSMGSSRYTTEGIVHIE